MCQGFPSALLLVSLHISRVISCPQIGGLTLAVVLDCTESQLYKNLSKSESPNDQQPILDKRIEVYRTQTLPVLKYLDEKSKLTVVCLLVIVKVIFSSSQMFLFPSTRNKSVIIHVLHPIAVWYTFEASLGFKSIPASIIQTVTLRILWHAYARCQ